MSHAPNPLGTDKRLGTRFGAYQVDSLVGIGGMGKVSKATAGDGVSQGMRVLWAHLEDEPPDPPDQRTDISPEFKQALKAALHKQPDERPGSSVEYAQLLSQAAGIPIDTGS